MSILASLAQRVGLVRTARHAEVLSKLKKLRAQYAALKRELTELRLITAHRKGRAEALATEVKRGQGHFRRAQQQVARRGVRLRKMKAENARLRHGLHALTDRLAAAERDLAVSRDALMLVEVKLDILEGAARVLDQRTRTDAALEPRTNASV